MRKAAPPTRQDAAFPRSSLGWWCRPPFLNVIKLKVTKSRTRFSGIWKDELQEIERKRTELLPEHQKMQQRLQRKHLKDACACEEEMQLLNQEMEEWKALFETCFGALSEKSGDCRKEATALDNEIQALQAGEERRGSCASQSDGCCFDPVMWVQQEFCRRY